MSALDTITAWLFDDGPPPHLDGPGLGEAARLLDELPADVADTLAGLVEDTLLGMPEAARRAAATAVLAVAGPRGTAVILPFTLAPGDGLTDRLCGWLFDNAPPPDAEAIRAAPLEALETLAALAALADDLCGDALARLRFDAAVLDPLEALIEAADVTADPGWPALGAVGTACLAPRIASPTPVLPTEEHPLTAVALEPMAAPAPRRRSGPWLLAIAAGLLAWMVWPRPPTSGETPPAPVAGRPTALISDAPAVVPRWPDAGRPAPTALAISPHRPALVPVPAGTFLMGSPADEPGRANDETRHQVTLSRGFYLGQTEVTQSQWRAVLGSAPFRFQGPVGGGADHPAENLTWYAGAAWLNALSALEGLQRCYRLSACVGTPGGAQPYTCGGVEFVGLDCGGYRYPTEAEWEFAARAGTLTATPAGPIELRDVRNAPVLDPIAWYSGNSGLEVGGLQCVDPRRMQHPATRCGTHPVGLKAPNALGLYDMIGNVWEWTGDGYAAHPTTPQVDPTGGADLTRRVTKGCGWYRDARFCRSANRYRPKPGYRASVIGLRPARSIR